MPNIHVTPNNGEITAIFQMVALQKMKSTLLAFSCTIDNTQGGLSFIHIQYFRITHLTLLLSDCLAPSDLPAVHSILMRITKFICEIQIDYKFKTNKHRDCLR